MKKIYLMRHGETLFNTMDVNQKEKAHDPNVPYDGGDEPDDTGQNARAAIGKAWADQ